MQDTNNQYITIAFLYINKKQSEEIEKSFFEEKLCHPAQAGLQHMATLLPQSTKRWYHKHVPLCSANKSLFTIDENTWKGQARWLAV